MDQEILKNYSYNQKEQGLTELFLAAHTLLQQALY